MEKVIDRVSQAWDALKEAERLFECAASEAMTIGDTRRQKWAEMLWARTNDTLADLMMKFPEVRA